MACGAHSVWTQAMTRVESRLTSTMSRRSQPPANIEPIGVEVEEEEVTGGVGEGDEIMEDAQAQEGEYSMSVE